MNLAIVSLGYQRAQYIFESLRTLSQNYDMQDIPLYIFIDGPTDTTPTSEAVKRNKSVLECVRSFRWSGKKRIIAAKTNQGLEKAFRSAVDTVLSDYDAVIVIEDDVVTGPYFFRFMKEALSVYKDDERISTICGYCYPFDRKIFNPQIPYFLRHFATPGWGTWRRAWENIEWSSKTLLQRIKPLGSRITLDMGLGARVTGILVAHKNGYCVGWDAKLSVSTFLDKQMCLFPPRSLSNNIGWKGDGGTHTGDGITDINAPLSFHEMSIPHDLVVQESLLARKAYRQYFYPNKLVEFKNFLISVLEEPARKFLKRPVKIGPFKKKKTA